MPIAALFFGIYLLLVGINGNSKSFLDAVKSSGDFVKWFLALLIFLVLWAKFRKDQIFGPIFSAAVFAFLLNALPTIKQQTSQAWQSL